MTKPLSCTEFLKNQAEPCGKPVVPGKTKCRGHGGLSTGPRTTEGLAKLASRLDKGANVFYLPDCYSGCKFYRLREAFVTDTLPPASLLYRDKGWNWRIGSWITKDLPKA